MQRALLALALCAGCASSPPEAMSHAPIHELWNFSDLDGTAQLFEAEREAAVSAGDDDRAAEFTTQLARVRGLERRFDEGRALLDPLLPRLDAFAPVVRVRYLLELGRIENTSGAPEAAVPHFLEAWNVARTAGEHDLAVDAAHMLGIAAPAEERLEWNRCAIEHAETCGDDGARRWLGSLYNNTAWTLHDAGDAEAALDLFQRAQAFRESSGDKGRTFIARWSVARCLRTLGRIEEALGMQRALLADRESAGAEPDGYVHEELGELLLLRGEDAAPQFAEAWRLLGGDPWLQANDASRLERLRRLGGVPSTGD